jgi:RNA polymerase sigma-70 factor (ECF subfamily)
MSEEQQRAWVEAARQGDESAFEQIFNQYHVAFFNLARHMVGDSDEAEDVVQQTFVKAFRGLPQMREPGRLETWLKRILYTTSIDALRHRKKHGASQLDEGLRYRSVPVRTPEGDAVVQEELGYVQQALQQMSPRYRTYILLREFDGLSYDEISEVLREPLTTVRVALFRAREQLRELLRQIAGEDIQ